MKKFMESDGKIRTANEQYQTTTNKAIIRLDRGREKMTKNSKRKHQRKLQTLPNGGRKHYSGLASTT